MTSVVGHYVCMTSALETAVEATIARLRALGEAEEQQQIRHQAYAQMHAEGLSHRRISDALKAELEKRGLTAAEIKAAGISFYSITLALSKVEG